MLRSQSAYFRNGSSRRWFVDGPRWQTKCSAGSWSALIACETSWAFSSLKKCCRVTEWKRSEMRHFSRSVSSLLVFKISLEPQYSPIQINFCENTFGHVLGNEVIHRSGFTIFSSFCSSYNLSTSERDQGNFWCSCQSNCEVLWGFTQKVRKDKNSLENLQPN